MKVMEISEFCGQNKKLWLFTFFTNNYETLAICVDPNVDGNHGFSLSKYIVIPKLSVRISDIFHDLSSWRIWDSARNIRDSKTRTSWISVYGMKSIEGYTYLLWCQELLLFDRHCFLSFLCRIVHKPPSSYCSLRRSTCLWCARYSYWMILRMVINRLRPM